MSALPTSRRGVLLGFGATAAIGPTVTPSLPSPVPASSPPCLSRLAETLGRHEATIQRILAAENERDSIRLGPQISTQAGLARDQVLECEVDALYGQIDAIREEASAIRAVSIPDLRIRAAWVRVSDDERVLKALLRDVEAFR